MALPTQWARVAFNFVSNEKPWQNIIYYTLNGAFPSNWNIATAAAALDAKFETKWRAIMNGQCEYAGVDLRVNNAGIVSTVSTFLSGSGSGSGQPIPDEVAAVVRLQTDQPGKSGRGRLFLSGLDGDGFLDGHFTPTFHTTLQTLGTEIQTHMTDQTIDWHAGVFSRHTASIHDILTTAVPVTTATQRRRRARR
jgi:hypothetical protein